MLIIFRERERERERESPQSSHERCGRVVRWCWVNFQCRDVLLIWIIVWQGLITLAVGAGHFLSRLSFLFSFSLSGRRSDIDWNSLKWPLNPKQLSNKIHSWVVWEHQSRCYHVYSKISDKNACRSIYRQWSDYSFHDSGFNYTTLFQNSFLTGSLPKGKLVTLFQVLLHSAFYFL